MQQAILTSVFILLETYYWVMILYMLSSWFPAIQSSYVGRICSNLVEPYLSLFRKVIPPIGMIDLSFLAGILLYVFILKPYILSGVQYFITNMPFT